YPHDSLRGILESTYGIIVYQEQVMQIAVRMAGYSMGEADLLRKAMGKKIREELIPHREKFVSGCVSAGYQRRLAESIFDLIVPFADYGFIASHACAYGFVAYQTAYLKAHHPVEFFSAMLTSVKDDKDKKPFYLNACRLMGIQVLPPDVNESEMDFTPVGGGDPTIRFGLSAVRNVGSGAVAEVIRARRAHGPFGSFSDFCRKLDPSVPTKKVLESLVLAGAFDSLGYTRRGLYEAYTKVSDPILAERKAEAAGQFSLFGGDDRSAYRIDEAVLHGPEFDRRDLLREEKAVLGQFVTDHPLLEIREAMAAQTDLELSETGNLGDGDLVTVGGIVAAVGRKYTKRGEPYALFRLEDLTGGVTVVAFPSVYEKVAGAIAPDRILLVRGRADLRGRELQLAAVEIREPVLAGDAVVDLSRPGGRVVVDLAAATVTNGMLSKLKDVLAAHPGRTPVTVRFVASGGVTPLKVGDGYSVDPTEGMLSELRRLLGPESVRLESAEAEALTAPSAP
ncbi:MAG: DNA polymerase III subunit alpha, partial [Actinobacteria bacterium]|nr:DNA polymerase III subunit alpha [Actinomycetota bacterium]